MNLIIQLTNTAGEKIYVPTAHILRIYDAAKADGGDPKYTLIKFTDGDIVYVQEAAEVVQNIIHYAFLEVQAQAIVAAQPR